MHPQEVNPVLHILRMAGQQVLRRRIQVQRHRRGLFADRIQDSAPDMAFVQQRLDIRVHRLLPLDGLRMDAAENQQLVVFGQIPQRMQGGFEPLVTRQEAKRANQFGVGRQCRQQRKLRPRRRLPDALRLFGRHITQRMMIDVLQPEHIAQQARIALCMDDDVDRMSLLPGVQQPVSPRTQFPPAAEGFDDPRRLVPAAPQQVPPDRRPIQRFVTQYGMKRNRYGRCRVHQPAQTAVDLIFGPSQRAIL
ncbi:hypothetical protein GALL_551480 [mine drainage metagenome]|uniref:Uncharacterized protein n=1 Tax=mine drainage metagenome TaxID=410659 RepID=A0A1J5P657_9ZZZZ